MIGLKIWIDSWNRHCGRIIYACHRCLGETSALQHSHFFCDDLAPILIWPRCPFYCVAFLTLFLFLLSFFFFDPNLVYQQYCRGLQISFCFPGLLPFFFSFWSTLSPFPPSHVYSTLTYPSHFLANLTLREAVVFPLYHLCIAMGASLPLPFCRRFLSCSTGQKLPIVPSFCPLFLFSSLPYFSLSSYSSLFFCWRIRTSLFRPFYCVFHIFFNWNFHFFVHAGRYSLPPLHYRHQLDSSFVFLSFLSACWVERGWCFDRKIKHRRGATGTKNKPPPPKTRDYIWNFQMVHYKVGTGIHNTNTESGEKNKKIRVGYRVNRLQSEQRLRRGDEGRE